MSFVTAVSSGCVCVFHQSSAAVSDRVTGERVRKPSDRGGRLAGDCNANAAAEGILEHS